MLPLLATRAGGRLLPGAEACTSGGAAHGGRMFREKVRGAPALPRQAPGAARPSGRVACCAWRCALRGVVFRGERGRDVRRRGALARSGSVPALLGAMVRRGARVGALLALALVRLLPESGVGSGSASRRRRSSRSCRAPRLAGAARAGGVGRAPGVSRRRRRARSRGRPRTRRCWLVVVVMAQRAGGARVARSWLRPRAPASRRGRRGRRAGRCSGSRCGTSPAGSGATRSSISPACGSCSRSTSCRSTASGEFADGGLHPGYAFPLWHGFLACVARLVGRRSGGRRAARVEHARARSRCSSSSRRADALPLAWLGGAVLAATAARLARAGHGGSYRALALPATASRQLLVPAVLALVFAHVLDPRRGALAGVAPAALVLTLVHPTYSLFLPCRSPASRSRACCSRRRDGASSARRSAAFARPDRGRRWLRSCPLVRDDGLVTGPRGRARGRARAASVREPGGRARGRQLPGRAGARLAQRRGRRRRARCSPARRAGRRRGAGPGSCSAARSPCSCSCSCRRSSSSFAEAVSLSQARRAAGFVPFAFAFAGGLWCSRGWSGCSCSRSRSPRGSRSSCLSRATYAQARRAAGRRWAPGSRRRRRRGDRRCGGAARARSYERPGRLACASRAGCSSCRSPCTRRGTGTSASRRDRR